MSTGVTINGLQHYVPDTGDAEWGGILSSYLHGLSYAKRAVAVFGHTGSGLVASTTSWLVPGYGLSNDEVFWTVPFTGVILQAGLWVRARTAPDAHLVLDLRKNGSSITASAQLNSGATTAQAGMLTSTSLSAGDRLSISVTPAVGYTTGGADLSISLVVNAT